MGLKLRYISQKFKGSLLRFSSAKIPNLELNFEFGPRGSGLNFGSEPNFGNTRWGQWAALGAMNAGE